MALTTANLIAEYVGKRAAGTTQGVNGGSPTTTWNDNVGTNDITLQNTGGNFAWTTDSGWAGAGTAGDPYRLVSDGTGDYGTLAAIPSAIATDHGFSIELWTLIPDVVANNTVLFKHRPTAYYGPSFYIDASTDQMAFSLGKGSTPYTYISCTQPCYSASPLHHVVTYDAATDILNFYRSSTKMTADTSAAFSPSTTGTPTIWQSNTSEGIAGICTLRIYDSCLSQTEVTDNYSAGVLAASTDGVWAGLTVTRLLQG